MCKLKERVRDLRVEETNEQTVRMDSLSEEMECRIRCIDLLFFHFTENLAYTLYSGKIIATVLSVYFLKIYLELPSDEKQLFSFIRKQSVNEEKTSNEGRLYIEINKELVKL